MKNKKFLENAYHTVGLFKVISVVIGVFYCIFWFYRFFNFPFAQNLAVLFDLPLKILPIPFETLSIDNGHVVENGYFIMGLIMGFVAFLFSRLEAFVAIIEKENEINEIRRLRDEEEKLNKELEKAYLKDLLKFNYYSMYVKYKIQYVNEIMAQNNALTIVDVLKRSYTESVGLIRMENSKIGIRQNKASLFIRGVGFEDFDNVLLTVLGAIKKIKAENKKDMMKTEFSIVIDAQQTEEACGNSYKLLEKISNSGYYNKAIATLSFKIRFDLMKKESRFMTDALGMSVVEKSKSDDDTELFLIKTKPQI